METLKEGIISAIKAKLSPKPAAIPMKTIKKVHGSQSVKIPYDKNVIQKSVQGYHDKMAEAERYSPNHFKHKALVQDASVHLDRFTDHIHDMLQTHHGYKHDTSITNAENAKFKSIHDRNLRNMADAEADNLLDHQKEISLAGSKKAKQEAYDSKESKDWRDSWGGIKLHEHETEENSHGEKKKQNKDDPNFARDVGGKLAKTTLVGRLVGSMISNKMNKP